MPTPESLRQTILYCNSYFRAAMAEDFGSEVEPLLRRYPTRLGSLAHGWTLTAFMCGLRAAPRLPLVCSECVWSPWQMRPAALRVRHMCGLPPCASEHSLFLVAVQGRRLMGGLARILRGRAAR
jgi:hypothetical protein